MGQVLVLAIVIVVLSVLLFMPIMLYVLRLGAEGWTVLDVALFATMLASTDAVAVSAILHSGETCLVTTDIMLSVRCYLPG